MNPHMNPHNRIEIKNMLSFEVGDILGQCYIIVNLDKKEYLAPNAFGDGDRLLEFGQSAGGTLFGLSALLVDGNGEGEKDIHTDNPLIGSWAGDRIVITGDYADEGKFLPDYPKDMANRLKGPNCNLYEYAAEYFDDISNEVVDFLSDSLQSEDEDSKEETVHQGGGEDESS